MTSTKHTGHQGGSPVPTEKNWTPPTVEEIEKAVEQASKSLTKARASLILDMPFFGMISLKMKETVALWMPTMATDGRHLFFNPFYVNMLSDNQLKAACAHECMHMALAHMARLEGREPGKWNAAGDYIINLILKDSNFTLGEGWLCDEQYRDMSEDEVYARLPTSKDQSGGEQEKDEGEDESEGHGMPMHGESHNHGKGCGGVLPLRGADGVSPATPAETEQFEAEAKVTLSQAAAMAKSQGKLPGSLERFVDEYLEPKVRWQDVLRLYVEHICKNDYSWSRPNSRHMQGGFYMPTLHNQELECMVIAVDTSGSVSKSELTQFATEMMTILETVNVQKIIVIYCDAVVEGVAEFTKADFPLPLTAFKPKGGGGTSFAPPFKYLEDEGIEPTVLVYMTDMCCNNYAPEPSYPVIWLSTEQGDPHWTDQAPYGEKIQVELDISY